MIIEHDILKIANDAGVRIYSDSKTASINQKLNLKNKSIWGVIFFLCCGIFLILMPFIKSSDLTTKIIGVIIGLSILILSALTIIRHTTDNVFIKNKNISFRYNLKLSSIKIDKNIKVIMKTNFLTIESNRGFPSTFIIVSHLLKTVDKEIPIFNFQMNKTETEKAFKLGNKITEILNAKLILECN